MTNAEFAILSLIAEHPRHGYEIEQLIQARGMREWTEIGFSSIYYLLKKLEKSGLIEADPNAGDAKGPKRKVFKLTRDGGTACRAATLEALSQSHKNFPPVLLGMANLPAVAPADALSALRSHHGELLGQLDGVAARQASQQPLPFFVDAMFDHGRTMLAAEIDWLERTIDLLEKRDDQD